VGGALVVGGTVVGSSSTFGTAWLRIKIVIFKFLNSAQNNIEGMALQLFRESHVRVLKFCSVEIDSNYKNKFCGAARKKTVAQCGSGSDGSVSYVHKTRFKKKNIYYRNSETGYNAPATCSRTTKKATRALRESESHQ
jgi:hypothetical protein